MKFAELGLRPEILEALISQGYDTPTPIQQQAIPVVLQGGDLMACAQTGTGKTAGFTLPILQRISTTIDPSRTRLARAPRVLVLVPTRELAIQVEESVRTYGKNLRLSSLAMYGGVGINPQIGHLRRGVDILVATPGRLLDHLQQKTLSLSCVEILVLDEADRMLDMGFIRDIRKILALIPAKRQSLLFSATFSEEIRELAQSFLKNPQMVEVARRSSAAETVKQQVIHVSREDKKDALLHLLETRGWHQVLVFARTKHGADALARKLDKAGIRSSAIHGDKTQGARVRALTDFKEGKLVVLVATDIAARGIDIDALPYVVNFELPNVPEDYVHRIGRTGRAGTEGEAYSLVCDDERVQLRDIQRLLKKELPVLTLAEFEPATRLGGPVDFSRDDSRPQAPRRPSGNGNNAGNNAPRKPSGNRSAAPAKPGGARGDTRTGPRNGSAGAAGNGGGTPSATNHRNGSRHR